MSQLSLSELAEKLKREGLTPETNCHFSGTARFVFAFVNMIATTVPYVLTEVIVYAN